MKHLLILSILISFYSSSQSNFGWDNGYLDVVTFRNGDSLFYAPTKEDWAKASENGIPAYCYYKNNQASGMLYNWFAVIDKRGLAPYGWRIPSLRDFEKLKELEKYYNQSLIELISSLEISGYRTFDGGDYYSKGEVSYYWTSSKIDGRALVASSFLVDIRNNTTMNTKNRIEDGLSIVCIRNYNEEIQGKGARSIQGPSEVCKGADSVMYKVVGGELASDAFWVWYNQGIKIGGGDEITLRLSKSEKIAVRSESFRDLNSQFINKTIEILSNCESQSLNTPPQFANKNLLNSNGVKDVDGNHYKTVIIGTQEWMAENLRTTHYANGNIIPQITSSVTWSNLSSGAYCWYDNNSSYENPFGKLYNGYTIDDARNVCPTGWHVPSKNDWLELIEYIGNNGYLGKEGEVLKSLDNWNSERGGRDPYGFSGLPGGIRGNVGSFYFIGNYGYWWSSTETNTYNAWSSYLNYNNGNVNSYYFNKADGISVRCLRD